ncbi:MAG: response regulator [Pirellulales bacterium]|jgi:two-component system chemotaxis response regulator CheY
MASNQLMIVDDSLIMRMKIKEIATGAGWNIVAEAKNGAEAVSLYEQHQPDLVTLDMVMPKMDGLNALIAIRKMDSQAQVVMISAVDQKEKLSKCIESGAMDFIVKPFDTIRLKALFTHYRKDETDVS